MSITSSIFNEHQINCTILGGKKRTENSLMNVSAVLVNSGNNHLRLQNLAALSKCGFKKIISIEKDAMNYRLEDFVQNFPEVKFIIPQETATDGDFINVAVSETETPHMLVLKDTIRLGSQILTAQLAQKLEALRIFCAVPRLVSQTGDSIPVQFVPSVKKSVFSVESAVQVNDGIDTLYPYSYLGFYDTRKFRDLGGYDYTIKNSYWQNLDLALRAWLWGERIKISTGFSMTCSDEIPVEDTTPDISQLRFFLKNIAPVYKDDHAELSPVKFFSFKVRSSCGIFETLRQFNSARDWVRANERRFVMDAFKLINSWGSL